jgi:hypothetical protein
MVSRTLEVRAALKSGMMFSQNTASQEGEFWWYQIEKIDEV